MGAMVKQQALQRQLLPAQGLFWAFCDDPALL